MSLKHILLLFLLIGGSSVLAQKTESIRLLDTDDALPIVGASFIYGDQSGVSSEDGTITFIPKQGLVMQLSHISYGSWSWTEAELQILVESRVFYRRRVQRNLYPVTVIGVRSSGQPEKTLNISYPDRMEHDGAALLDKLPAFGSIRKSGNYGFDPVFRGFKYDQLNVVLNGAQAASAACPNRMDPPTSQMAPNMMDRIEVLKGPHALRYGTGLGATINFIPTQLRFTGEPDQYGRISAGYEGNGNIFRTEGQLGFSGDFHDVSIFGGWSEGDDYTAGNGETVQAGFNRASLGTNIGLKLSKDQQIRLSAVFNIARDADFAALPMDLRKDNTWLLNARHDVLINRGNLESWNTTIFGSWVDHTMDNLMKQLDPRMVNAETTAKTYNYGGRTEGTWSFSQNKLYAGADLRVEGASGTRVREFLMGPNAGKVVTDNVWQDGQISRAGLFSEYHLGAGSVKLIFSGRLEVNTANVDDPSPEFIQQAEDTRSQQVNPNLSVGMVRPFDSGISISAWLGRAQRSGSLTERFINYFPVGQDPYEILGNPEVDPEVNNQLDLGFKWEKDQTLITFDVFASYLQDYISSVIDTTLTPRMPSSPGVRRVVNIDEAFRTGFEVTWTQALPIGLQQQLGFAYTYAQDLTRNEPLPEIPPLDIRYELSGTYLNDRLVPGVGLRYVAQQARVSEEFGETRTPDFFLIDLKIGYDVLDGLQLRAGVNNLLNKNYYEHLNRSVRGTNTPIYDPGRNIFASVSYSFQ